MMFDEIFNKGLITIDQIGRIPRQAVFSNKNGIYYKCHVKRESKDNEYLQTVFVVWEDQVAFARDMVRIGIMAK